jgi:CRP-like cAMP-binding protein
VPHSPLVRMFNSSINLSLAEEDAIRALPMRVKVLAAKQELIAEQNSPKQCCVVLEGYACTYRDVRDGNRQILSFHVRGDMPDLQNLHLGENHDNIGSIGPLTLGLINSSDLHRICREFPRVAAALWRLTLIDASIYKEWVSNVGARDARTRTAHLFCELHHRQRAIGQVEGNSFEWPLTQMDLGDALGLSVVHVHRTLKSLRDSRLIDYQRGVLRIPDIDALMKAGDFDAGYLHMRSVAERAAMMA